VAKKGVIAYPFVQLGLDASQYKEGLRQVGQGFKTFATMAQSAFRITALPGVALAGLVGPLNQGLELAAKLGRTIGQPFAQLMNQEKAAKGLALVAGNAEAANIAFAQLRNISRNTGTDLGELAGDLKTLMGAGLGLVDATSALTQFAKVAGALGEGGLGRLVQASADFAKATFASVESLDKLASEGIPIYRALAEELSRMEGAQVSVADAAARAARGEISGEVAGRALTNAAASPEMQAAAQAADRTLSGLVAKFTQTAQDTFARIGEFIVKTFNIGAIEEFSRGFLDAGRQLVEALIGPLGNAFDDIGDSFKAGGDFFQTVLEKGSVFLVAFVQGLEESLKYLETIAQKLESALEGSVRFFDHIKEMLKRPITGTIEAIYDGIFGGPSGPPKKFFSANPLGSDRLENGLAGLIGNFNGFRAGGGVFNPNQAGPNMAQIQAKQAQETAVAQGKAIASAQSFSESLDTTGQAAKAFADKAKQAQSIADQMAKAGVAGVEWLGQTLSTLKNEVAQKAYDFSEGLFNTAGALGGLTKTLEQIEIQGREVGAAGLNVAAFTEDAGARAIAGLVKNFRAAESNLMVQSQSLGSAAEVEARIAERFGTQRLTTEQTIQAAAMQAHEDAQAQRDFLKDIAASVSRMGGAPTVVAFARG
jgi:hypothetical protein